DGTTDTTLTITAPDDTSLFEQKIYADDGDTVGVFEFTVSDSDFIIEVIELKIDADVGAFSDFEIDLHVPSTLRRDDDAADVMVPSRISASQESLVTYESPFYSVSCFGGNAEGSWKVKIVDTAGYYYNNFMTIYDLQLTFYGYRAIGNASFVSIGEELNVSDTTVKTLSYDLSGASSSSFQVWLVPGTIHGGIDYSELDSDLMIQTLYSKVGSTSFNIESDFPSISTLIDTGEYPSYTWKLRIVSTADRSEFIDTVPFALYDDDNDLPLAPGSDGPFEWTVAMIIGIIFGCIVLILTVVCCISICKKNKQRKTGYSGPSRTLSMESPTTGAVYASAAPQQQPYHMPSQSMHYTIPSSAQQEQDLYSGGPRCPAAQNPAGQQYGMREEYHISNPTSFQQAQYGYVKPGY
ncbi:Peptidase S8, subtilisin-related like protein, partial [Aduncisulcus paluster]